MTNDSEYRAIRGNAGIWDYSDLVKIRVSGERATEALDGVVAGNVENLQENSIRHTLMLDESGQILVDVMIFADFDEYIVTCAPEGRERMLPVLEAIGGDGVDVEDISDRYSVWVVEGPEAWKISRDIVGMEATGVRLLGFLQCDIDGNEGLLVRIGSSGEYGYMFWVAPDAAAGVLDRIREIDPEAVVCERDIQHLLKLEVRAFNLERDVIESETPLQAGLHWMIDFHKDAFTGRDALLAERQAGLTKKLVAFQLVEEGALARSAGIFDGDEQVGYGANHGFSPTLGCSIGLAYLDAEYAWVGLQLAVEAEAGKLPMTTVSAPFFITESNAAPMA